MCCLEVRANARPRARLFATRPCKGRHALHDLAVSVAARRLARLCVSAPLRRAGTRNAFETARPNLSAALQTPTVVPARRLPRVASVITRVRRRAGAPAAAPLRAHAPPRRRRASLPLSRRGWLFGRRLRGATRPQRGRPRLARVLGLPSRRALLFVPLGAGWDWLWPQRCLLEAPARRVAEPAGPLRRRRLTQMWARLQ